MTDSKRTGVFVTPDEIEEIKRIANRLCVYLIGHTPETAQQACHHLALAHGLPDFEGYYGCDLQTGEIIGGTAQNEGAK